jgi:4-hydroxy-3-methylbut-2-enyl diphosphate reductase
VAYVTQTTLSVDDTRDLIAALERRYPGLKGPELDDICYATQNRQLAVKQLATEAEVIVVVGATNSSNSHRLREVAEQCGRTAYLVGDAQALDPAWFDGVECVGVTAGASAPEYLVEGVRRRLAELGATSEREIPGVTENVTFRLPPAVLVRHEPRRARTLDAPTLATASLGSL